MRTTITALFTFMIAECFSQQLGSISHDAFFSVAELSNWFQMPYNNYTPKVDAIDKIASRKSELTFTIILGTWCSDSKDHVPAIIKMLDKAGVPVSSIQIYAVNEGKNDPPEVVRRYEVKHVPTLIVSKFNGSELGRVVESPEKSWEEDVARMLK
jgi:hypothetical protein